MNKQEFPVMKHYIPISQIIFHAAYTYSLHHIMGVMCWWCKFNDVREAMTPTQIHVLHYDDFFGIDNFAHPTPFAIGHLAIQ